MTVLNIIKTEPRDKFDRCWRNLRAKLSLEGELLGNKQRLEQVRDIVEKVRQGRDAAVAKLTAAYDKVELSPNEFRISEKQLSQAHKQLDSELLAALRQSIVNVKKYQQKIMVREVGIPTWNVDKEGLRLGVIYRPLKRVGVCVPGASAPLVSTVIMTVVPAQVAGVEQIAVISAPRPDCDNSIHPAILGVCWELGVKEVYRVSGAQGVAALAFGTETIGRVDKIVGPSSWWGQLAKKEVYGLVDIDSFAGPSEVLIIADDSARGQWLAADMLSQAEHAPGSALLITDSEQLSREVAEQLDKQLAELSRKEATRQCVQQFCLAVVTRDMDEAIDLANEFAAEHLQIQCKDSETIAGRIENAGAIFVGEYSPVAIGDYFAGPSHTLPTGGSARFFSPLHVNDFLRHSSLISYGKKGLETGAKATIAMARAEGLDAHARSVEIRVQKQDNE